MKKRFTGTWKKKRKKEEGYWPVQINIDKSATCQILKKPEEGFFFLIFNFSETEGKTSQRQSELVEVVKGQILAGGAQKSPEPCFGVT
jgi:hypothetical protein